MKVFSNGYQSELDEVCMDLEIDPNDIDDDALLDILHDFASITDGDVKYSKNENGCEIWSTNGEHLCADPDPAGTMTYYKMD